MFYEFSKTTIYFTNKKSKLEEEFQNMPMENCYQDKISDQTEFYADDMH